MRDPRAGRKYGVGNFRLGRAARKREPQTAETFAPTDQGTVDFPLRVVELNLLALASDFVDYSDASERPRARRTPARTSPTERAAFPPERTTDSEKGLLGKHGHTRHATPRHRHPGIAISEPSDKRNNIKLKH